MPTGGDLGTHGEAAIGDAQRGMRHDDMPVRIGVMLWAFLGLGGWIMAQRFLPQNAGLPVWEMVLIVVVSGVFTLVVSGAVSRWNTRKRDRALAEIRSIDAAERQRQLDAFQSATGQIRRMNKDD